MRIAILADIHANVSALEAVIADLELTQPDRVIVAGPDIVELKHGDCHLAPAGIAESGLARFFRRFHRPTNPDGMSNTPNTRMQP